MVVFIGLCNTRNLLLRGPQFHADSESGILTEPPVVIDLGYILEPAVDADGDDIDGVRSTIVKAPLGTCMGWNYRAAGFDEGDLCDLTGSFIPLAGTQAQGMTNGQLACCPRMQRTSSPTPPLSRSPEWESSYSPLPLQRLRGEFAAI
jgi:hypothetical protein